MTASPQPIVVSTSSTSDEAEFWRLPADHVDFVWAVAGPLLEKATDLDRKCTLEQLHHDLVQARAQLWLAVRDQVIEGALVTAIAIYPDRKICQLVFCGGSDVSFWVKYRTDVEGFALENGCASMEIVGRRGWGRLCPDFEEIGTIYAKEIA